MTVCYWCGAKDTLADIGKELDDGKYKMVQCRKCKNAYYVVNKEKMNKQKPQTNEEWFCTLPTEEKADKLTDFSFWLVPTIPTEDKREQIRKKIAEWLKQPHTVKG